MITAGVQQALQTLEVSGASPSALPGAPVAGEEFRNTLTATVGGNLPSGGSDRAAAQGTGAGVAQSHQAAEQITASRLWSLEQAKTAAQSLNRQSLKDQSLKSETLAAEAAARAKSNSATVSASKLTAAAGTAGATKSTSDFEEEAEFEPNAAPVPVLAKVEAGQQAVVAEDTVAASLRARFDTADLTSELAGPNLPGTAKASGTGQGVENTGVRSRKGDVTSSAPQVAAGSVQAAFSSDTLATLLPGPLTSSSVVAPSIGVSERLPASETSVALSTSTPVQTVPGIGSLGTATGKNSGEDAVDRSDAQPLVTAGPLGLVDAASSDLSAARSSAARSSVARSSAANPQSADAATERLDRSGDQPGLNTRPPEGVSERIGISDVAPKTGLLSGPEKGVGQAGALGPTSVSTRSISGIAADLPETASTVSTTRGAQASIRNAGNAGSELHGVLSGAALSGNAGPSGNAGVAGKKTVAVGAEKGSSIQTSPKSTEDSATATQSLAARSEDNSPAPVVSESPRPAGLPGAALPSSQSALAAGRTRTARQPADKGPSDDDDAIAAAQTASAKDSSTAVPLGVSSQTGDLAGSAAPVTAIGGAAASAHVASAPLAGPVALVHAAGSPTAIAGNSVGRSDASVATVATAQASTTSQGGDSHRTTLATPTTLEVGLQSGTQGWLKIRAEAVGQGDVKASLDAVSASGRELLHSQLPALNAFLHSEQMPVTASVAERSTAADTGSAGTAMGSSGASHGAHLQQGGDQQASDRQGNAAFSGTSTRGATEAVKSYDAQGSVSDFIEGLSARQPGTPGGNGQWLNVRV